jgi:hypothetical protein
VLFHCQRSSAIRIHFLQSIFRSGITSFTSMGSCAVSCALRRFQFLLLPILHYSCRPRHWSTVGKLTSRSFPLYEFGIFLADFPASIGEHLEILKNVKFNLHYLHQHCIVIKLLCIKSIDLDESCWLTLKWVPCQDRVRNYTEWKFPKRGGSYRKWRSLPPPPVWSGAPPEDHWRILFPQISNDISLFWLPLILSKLLSQTLLNDFVTLNFSSRAPNIVLNWNIYSRQKYSNLGIVSGMY